MLDFMNISSDCLLLLPADANYFFLFRFLRSGLSSLGTCYVAQAGLELM